jgi:dipeptidyl aminopeptidase/acylaminoacyl peptidase
LAPKDILLIAGWDDGNVSIENIVLPLYRSLKNEKAMNVKIIAVPDSHSFRNSRDELTQIIIEWLNFIDKEEK